MGIYAFIIWLLLSPVVILVRKPSADSRLKSALLFLPIFCFVTCFVVNRLVFLNDDIESTFLWFFYALGIAVTYTSWWEILWRFYYKKWSKKIFGEYFISNIILLLSAWPTFIVLLILLGLIFGSISVDVGRIFAAFGLFLFYGAGWFIYEVIHFLVCIFDSHC